jgi:hypothetical protein
VACAIERGGRARRPAAHHNNVVFLPWRVQKNLLSESNGRPCQDAKPMKCRYRIIARPSRATSPFVLRMLARIVKISKFFG